MNVPVDFFGVAGNQHIQDLLNMSTSRAKRKTAFNQIARLAKIAGIVPKSDQIVGIALDVNYGGEQSLKFTVETTFVGAIP